MSKVLGLKLEYLQGTTVLRFQALIKRLTKLLDSDRLSRGQSCFLERNQHSS